MNSSQDEFLFVFLDHLRFDKESFVFKVESQSFPL